MSTDDIREVVKLTALLFVRYIEAHADAKLENFRAKISRGYVHVILNVRGTGKSDG